MSGAGRAVRLIDVICGYACNSGCVFCALEERMRGDNMDARTVVAKLQRALARHPAAGVRFGGGEPTLRPDLPSLVAWCGKRGLPFVSLQTNGYRLADPRYVAALRERGLTKVNLSYRSARPDVYARLTRVERAHELATAALDNVLAAGLTLEVDTLVTTDFVAEADELMGALAARGVPTVNHWYISREGRVLGREAALVPTLTAAAAALRAVFAASPQVRQRVFYMPYCLFPGDRVHPWNPVEEDTLVITPADEFLLEKGTIDLGVKTPRCAPCVDRGVCPGVRANYLERFGDAELVPVLGAG
jgi:MoaA/NifB/PqqE/SkfB family radical SAM enzyme